MPLADYLKQLDDLVADATDAFTHAADKDSLEASRIEFLGAKSGRLKTAQKQMGLIDKLDRASAGKRFNEVKLLLLGSFEAAQKRLMSSAAGTQAAPVFDPTVPGPRSRLGHLHPITQTIEELKDIMGRLGFTVADGPEVEDEWHNFDALNIPREHPARDPLENFYLATGNSSAGKYSAHPTLLLRSQTSTVQIRAMEKTSPPVRIISLGRVYRPDTADASHYPMFHQMEGLLVDRHVTMADLKSVLRMIASTYLGAEVHIRFRPSFFPFTEPSVEADYRWNEDWIEFGGAGMVDPHVLQAVGYDPEQLTGFAFGLGIERLCMRRHGITDIREFYKNDLRFLEQF